MWRSICTGGLKIKVQLTPNYTATLKNDIIIKVILNIDTIIFLAFLAVTLLVGFKYGRGIKTIDDYALGGRNFSTLALVSTILATWVSGGMFFVGVSKIYANGLNYFIPSTCMCLQILIVGTILVPRMSRFLGKISVAEAMGSLYGKEVRLITAICGIAGMVGGIAVQFKIFGTLFNYFFGVPSVAAVFIASSIVIIYSAFGGIRAVTHTDILQALTFTLSIPLVAIIIWLQIHQYELNYSNILSNENFDIARIFSINNPNLLSIIFLIVYFSFPTVDSMDFQRIAIGKNIKQVRNAFVISAILFALVKCMIALTPILILNIKDDIEPSKLISYIIDNYTYAGLKGLIIIGVAAMAMSTADSRINSAVVLFAHDLQELFNMKVNKLLLSKIFSCVLGAFAIYLALTTNDLFGIVVASASFYMPVVSVPLVLSILGFRTTKKPILIAMIGGLVFIIVWQILGIAIDGIVPAMIFNLVLLFGSHYILRQPGGWIDTRDKVFYDSKKSAKRRLKNKIMYNIANFNFVKFCTNNALDDDVSYTLFGVFCFITSIAIIYALPVPVDFEHSQILVILYQSMVVISNFFLLYLVWSQRIKNKKFISIVWIISVVHILCFCSTFFLLLSNFHNLVLVVFILDIVVMFSLVRWQVAIPMIIFGVALGIILYFYYINLEGIKFAVSYDYSDIIYVTLLITTVFITIIKPVQSKNQLIEQKVLYQASKLNIQKEELAKALDIKNEFLRNLQHETNHCLVGIKSMSDICYSAYDKLNDHERKKCLANINDSSIKLAGYIANITDLSNLTSMKYKFKMEKIDMEQLIHDRIEMCQKLYISPEDQKNYEFILNIQENMSVLCDKYYITQVLDNIINNAIEYSDGGKIIICASQGQADITISVEDEGVGIGKGDLYDIFGVFVISDRTKTLAGGRGIGLALCKKIIELHKGKIWAESDGKSGAKFTFTIPRSLH